MAALIRQHAIVEDSWNTVRLADGETAASVHLGEGDHLFPLSVWQTRKQEIISAYKRIGIWIDSHESIDAIANDLHYFQVVAINFPKFADGRGYSIARLLRERHAYEGEIRAIGDVLQDQVFYLKRSGFDAFALRADRADLRGLEEALAALDTFPEAYQAAADQKQPLFRRRAQGLARLADVSDE